MNPSDNLIMTLLAIWKAGAAYLPIDVDFPPNRIEHYLNEAKPVLVIHDNACRNLNFFSSITSIQFRDLKRESLEMDSENIPDELMLKNSGVSSTAIVLFTSGSSGAPKGVRLSHHTLYHRIHWQLCAYPFSETEQNCIFKTPLSFVDHFCEIWCPLVEGRTVVVVPKEMLKDLERFVNVLKSYKIERIICVPTLLQSILKHLKIMDRKKSHNKLPHLKIWISSGESLTMQLAHEFFEYFGEGRRMLVNFYECAELNSDATTCDLNSEVQLHWLEKIPIGFPIHNSIIYVLDKNMKLLDLGEIGEIYVSGVNVSDGYINQDANNDNFMLNPMESEERKVQLLTGWIKYYLISSSIFSHV